MKVLICGSRTINDYNVVKKAIQDSGFYITEVVSGGAKGVDRLGEMWAREHNVRVKQFLPEWNKYGKQAGILRNKEMVDYADAVIAIWDGESKGTKWTIDYACKHGFAISIFEINDVVVFYINKS